MRRTPIVCTLALFMLAGVLGMTAPAGGSDGCAHHYGVTKTRAYARYTYALHHRAPLRESHLARMIHCQHVPAKQAGLRSYRRQLFRLWRVECSGPATRVGGASVFGDRDYGIATRSYVNPWGYWILIDPRGGATVEQQTDWGPGIMYREFDLTRDAADAHGYPYEGFPTDQGTWTGRFIGGRIPSGLRYGRVVLLCR